MAQIVPDGNKSFSAGQNPRSQSLNGYYAGVNVRTYGDRLLPRWGIKFKKLNFLATDGSLYLTLRNKRQILYEDAFHIGRFQALIPYTIGNNYYLLAVIAGIPFLVNVDTYQVTVLVSSDKSRMSDTTPRLNWSAAGKFYTILDFPDYPMILDGIVLRRADPKKLEIPIALIAAYNNNRLFIGNNGEGFTAGDPVGSDQAPNAPITFQEVILDNTGFTAQVFGLPTGERAPITAMAALPAIDESTGIGPLLIGTTKAIYSVQSQNPRTQWQSSKFATLYVPIGIVGARAHDFINSELFFLSPDNAVRSASMSRSEQGKWDRSPLSLGVEEYLIAHDPSLLKYSFVRAFKNRLFISTNMHRVPARTLDSKPIFDYAAGGIVSFVANNASQIGQSSPPAWDGLWTGVLPMDMAVQKERCFMIAKEGGFNSLFEMDPKTTSDTDSVGNERYIQSILYTRDQVFQDPFVEKQVQSIDLDLREVKGDLTVTVESKPSHSPWFLFWKTIDLKAPWRTKKFPSDDEINGFGTYEFLNFRVMPPTSEDCNPVTRDFFDWFKTIRMRLSITAKSWALYGFQILAKADVRNQTEAICSSDKQIEIMQQPIPDWKIPEDNGCHPNLT